MFDLAATDFPQGSCPALIILVTWWIRSLGIEFVHLVLVWQEHIDQRQLIDNSHAGGICLFYEGIQGGLGVPGPGGSAPGGFPSIHFPGETATAADGTQSERFMIFFKVRDLWSNPAWLVITVSSLVHM